MFPTKFRFIWPSGFRGEDFFKLANQKQELPVATMFVNGSDSIFQLIYGKHNLVSFFRPNRILTRIAS
jgi:hypothetical protein